LDRSREHIHGREIGHQNLSDRFRLRSGLCAWCGGRRDRDHLRPQPDGGSRRFRPRLDDRQHNAGACPTRRTRTLYRRDQNRSVQAGRVQRRPVKQGSACFPCSPSRESPPDPVVPISVGEAFVGVVVDPLPGVRLGRERSRDLVVATGIGGTVRRCRLRSSQAMRPLAHASAPIGSKMPLSSKRCNARA
jgi:hypothetical protein